MEKAREEFLQGMKTTFDFEDESVTSAIVALFEKSVKSLLESSTPCSSAPQAVASTEAEAVKEKKPRAKRTTKAPEQADNVSTASVATTVSKRKLSAYNIFIKENMKTVPPTVATADRMSYLSNIWKSMSEEEKNHYKAPTESAESPAVAQ